MREITLEAAVRTKRKKGTRSLRREGKVPGVYYIHGEENIAIEVPEKSLQPLYRTAETHIITLKLNAGGEKSCILRDIQFDAVTETPLHFDLQGLREDEEINVEVPVVVTGGTPVGVRDGGILQLLMHRLKISCLPKFIPEHVEVNVLELKMNSFIHVRDLKLENVTLLDPESSSIVGVVPPTVEKEVAPGTPAVEETLEPEVIAKGKKPEEGAEGEAEKKPEAAAKTPPAKEEKEKK
jgi:large subunit ribosomal protein L25